MLAKRTCIFTLLVLLTVTAAAPAAEKRTFKEARFEKGQLQYVNNLPVLTVEGTPKEMGRQEAALTGEVAKSFSKYPRQLMTLSGQGKKWDKCVETGAR